MRTRNGIYYDLKQSTYHYTIDGVMYVFSSFRHRQKFKEKLEDHREQINASLSKRFGISVNVDLLADIVLYRKVETRGFLIVKEGQFLNEQNISFKNGEVSQIV